MKEGDQQTLYRRPLKVVDKLLVKAEEIAFPAIGVAKSLNRMRRVVHGKTVAFRQECDDVTRENRVPIAWLWIVKGIGKHSCLVVKDIERCIACFGSRHGIEINRKNRKKMNASPLLKKGGVSTSIF